MTSAKDARESARSAHKIERSNSVKVQKQTLPKMLSSSNKSAGYERLKADMRQIGGLILALGICAMFGALAGVATGVSRDGGTPSENGIPLWSLIGACGQAFFGAIAIVVGYLSTIADTGNRALTIFLCVAVQLSWIPYITGMAGIGKQAANPETQILIPADLNPTDSDVMFVGAMGILTILAHGFAFIGSLSFVSFSLLAYQSGKPQDRPAGYYHGRLFIYALIVVLAGLTQFVLGIFILLNYGGGPLDNSVNVAVYTIFFPEISVFVGLVQLVTGGMGLYRYLNPMKVMEKTNDWSYQILCCFMWFMMMILQLMVQVSYAPGGAMAAAAPSRACVFFGFALMPAYLDYKMRNTPKIIESTYYGLFDKNEEAAKDVDFEKMEQANTSASDTE